MLVTDSTLMSTEYYPISHLFSKPATTLTYRGGNKSSPTAASFGVTLCTYPSEFNPLYPAQPSVRTILPEILRIVRRTSCCSGLRPINSKAFNIQAVHKSINETDRVLFADVLFNSLGKHELLMSAGSLDVHHKECSPP